MPAKPLDENAFTERLRGVFGRDVAPIQPLAGGHSSLTFWTTVDGTEKVAIKVCPPGLEPVRNRDMLRQARMQKALTDTAVPVPRVVAQDAGDPPDVPPFFAMEFLPGECVEVGFAAAAEGIAPEHIRTRQLQTAQFMGALHRVDPFAIGMGDEPETTLDEEVQRWSDSLAACDEDLRAGTEDVGERLLASIPTAMTSTILHGDFRTGNTLADGGDIVAIIDWEIWSRSDPRVDVAWFLQFVENAASPPPGTPSPGELLDAYEAASGRPLPDLDWFRALVRYKQVAAGAFIQRNARRRGGEVVLADNTNNPLLTSARAHLDAIGG